MVKKEVYGICQTKIRKQQTNQCESKRASRNIGRVYREETYGVSRVRTSVIWAEWKNFGNRFNLQKKRLVL